MTVDAQALLCRWSYKPGWKFSVHEEGSEYALGVSYLAPDSNQPDRQRPFGGVFYQFVDAFDSDDAFFEWVRSVTHLLEHHEMNEWARVDGVPLENPHRFG